MKRIYMVLTVIVSIVVVLGITAMVILRHPSFGKAPQGERLERIRRSPNFRDGQFMNISPTQQITSDKGRLQTMWNFLFSKKEHVKPDYPLPVQKQDLHSLDRTEDMLVWFGHSSYFIQADGVRFLVDPVLTSVFPASFMFKPFKGTDVYTPEDIPDVDYLIITHDHWDHLDYETVKQIKNRVGKVICGLGIGAHLEYWGYDVKRILELDWEEGVSLADGFTVYCLPARHFSGRTFTPNITLWASYMIETPTQRIFVAGDGGYDSHFAEIGKRFAPIDLAVMENGQYNKDWRYIHLLPEELPEAIKDLNPRQVLTVHHSKYALSKHAWDEPLNRISQSAAEAHIDLLTPMIGEPVHLRDTAGVFAEWWKQ